MEKLFAAFWIEYWGGVHMGLQRDVTFTGEAPSWEALRDRLAAAGVPVGVRMIDNLPAFPDEVPQQGWRELRLATAHGMVTLRQAAGRLSVVVWGNADRELLRERDTITSVIADVTTGIVGDPG
jgi:hypothetical protein